MTTPISGYLCFHHHCLFFLFVSYEFLLFLQILIECQILSIFKKSLCFKCLDYVTFLQKKLTLALKIFIQIGIEMIGGCTSIFVITTLFHFPLPLRPIASKALKVSHTCPLSHAWNSNSLTPAMIL